MIYVDSTLFVYAGDPTGPREKYQKFISQNRSLLATSALTIDEVAWVLKSKTSLEEAVAFCEKVISSGIAILEADRNTAEEALALMKRYRLKPRDAFHAATMHLHGIRKIASEDKDFDKIPGIKRIWF